MSEVQGTERRERERKREIERERAREGPTRGEIQKYPRPHKRLPSPKRFIFRLSLEILC